MKIISGGTTGRESHTNLNKMLKKAEEYIS